MELKLLHTLSQGKNSWLLLGMSITELQDFSVGIVCKTGLLKFSNTLCQSYQWSLHLLLLQNTSHHCLKKVMFIFQVTMPPEAQHCSLTYKKKDLILEKPSGLSALDLLTKNQIKRFSKITLSWTGSTTSYPRTVNLFKTQWTTCLANLLEQIKTNSTISDFIEMLIGKKTSSTALLLTKPRF